MTPSLAALIEMVEKLEKPGPHEALPNGLVSLTRTVFGVSWAQNCLFRALRGDLSSAVVFTEELLPEALWSVTGMHPLDPCHGPHASLSGYFGPEGPEGRSFDHVDTQAPTPALALVLATLRAHAAKETT